MYTATAKVGRDKRIPTTGSRVIPRINSTVALASATNHRTSLYSFWGAQCIVFMGLSFAKGFRGQPKAIIY